MNPFQFCPWDGCRLEQAARPLCTLCGFIDWGNPKPCVVAMVQHKGQVLFGKRAHEPGKGKWDILGGFIEGHETAEQAIIREVSEETGLVVKVKAYLGSWTDVYGNDKIPILNFAYVTELAEETASHPPLKISEENLELQWLAPSQFPADWAFAHQPPVIKAWLEYSSAGIAQR